jgi:hypothetical protein
MKTYKENEEGSLFITDDSVITVTTIDNNSGGPVGQWNIEWNPNYYPDFPPSYPYPYPIYPYSDKIVDYHDIEDLVKRLTETGLYNKDKNTKEGEITMQVFEVFVIDTKTDEVLSHSYVVSSREDLIIARMGFSEDELKRIDKGDLVVHSRPVTSYTKPKKDKDKN